MSDFADRSTHKARKAHQCFACGDTINAGEVYSRWTGSYDGEFFSSPEHLACSAAYDAWEEAGDAVGEGYALDAAYEESNGALDTEAHRRDDESNRDFVARMLKLHRERKAARAARKASAK